jgi:hypothetical protein
VAVQDAFHPPVVTGLITQTYKGTIGDAVVVQVSDNFKVAAVKVSIQNAAGELIEDGAAVKNTDGLNWIYTATAANPNLPGTKITATATDLPGNEGSLEMIL